MKLRQWVRLQKIHAEAWWAVVRLWWRHVRSRRRITKAAAVAYGATHPGEAMPRTLTIAEMRAIIRRRRRFQVRQRRAGFWITPYKWQGRI